MYLFKLNPIRVKYEYILKKLFPFSLQGMSSEIKE